MQTTTDVPPLSIRAAVQGVNESDRSVEVTFSTGAAVERLDYLTGRKYLERLSLKAEHVNLERLNNGAPLLDSHSAWSIADQIGVVEDARIIGGEARARIRFSRRQAVDAIWQDIKDRIYTSVSVGYRVHKYQETPGKDGAIPTRLAVDWEPFELSLVPMPADVGAKVRDGEREAWNRCALVRSGLVNGRTDAERVQWLERALNG